MKRVAILQSSYIPWRGYFDIIGCVDEFVLYDVVQFTKRDWRNRNRIKTAGGPRWLTIPVATAGAYHQTIADTRISGANWAETHWRSLVHAYAHAPHFDRYRDRCAELYRECGSMVSLSSVNRLWIEWIAAELGVATRITDSADHAADGDRNGKLIGLCQSLGAGTYVSGPSARSYLDVDAFQRAGIGVEYMDYSGYQPYPQLHGQFEPSVSVLDLLFNTGPDARSHTLCGSVLVR
jgi:hypothetical protein